MFKARKFFYLKKKAKKRLLPWVINFWLLVFVM